MTRLIDADDMIKSLMDMTFYDEEGHIIDDYEDRLAIVKSFVDPVSTVEAIPIEFIRKAMDVYKKDADEFSKKDQYILGITVIERYVTLKLLIDDWKKENKNEFQSG